MCEEDKKVFTFVITDAQRRGDAPTIRHDSFSLGIFTYHWVYTSYDLYLAPTSLRFGLRREVDVARWTSCDGGQVGAEAAGGDQRRYQLACKFFRRQFPQLSGPIVRCHIDRNTFAINRFCVSRELHLCQETKEVKFIDLTKEDDQPEQGEPDYSPGG